MKKLILLCLLLLSTNAVAEKIVDCSAVINENVRIQTITAEELARSGLAGGTAGTDSRGRPMIAYEQWYDSIPEVKNHILAHECAHHALGHVFSPVIRNYWANERIKEHPADCMASQILVNQLGYGDNEFNVIADFLKQDQVQGAARAQRVLNCAK